jgi:hypothetical protein
MSSSSHIILLVIALLLGLSILFVVASRAFNSLNGILETIERVRLDLKGGNPKDIPSWLTPLFQTSGHSLFVTAARETCRQQVDELLSSQKHYLILRKSLTASPLIGVVLTAFGFAAVDFQIENLQSFVGPLVGGVAVGAVLALVCQVFLYLVESQIDETRMLAVGLVNDVWATLAQQVGDPNRATVTAIKALDETTRKLQNALGNFPQNVNALTKKFESIHDMSREVFTVLEGLATNLNSVSAQWKNSSTTMKESIDKELCPSISAISTAINSIVSSASILDRASQSISDTIKEQHNASAKHIDVQLESCEIVKKEIESQRRIFADQVEQVKQSQSLAISSAINVCGEIINQFQNTLAPHLKAISSGTQSMRLPLSEMSTFLTEVNPRLKDSSVLLSTISAFASDFKNNIIDPLAPSFQSMRDLENHANQLGESVKLLAESLKEFEKASHAGAIFSDLLQKRAVPTVEVLQRATGTFEDSANILAESTQELGEVINELNRRLLANANGKSTNP